MLCQGTGTTELNAVIGAVKIFCECDHLYYIGLMPQFTSEAESGPFFTYTPHLVIQNDGLLLERYLPQDARDER